MDMKIGIYSNDAGQPSLLLRTIDADSFNVDPGEWVVAIVGDQMRCLAPASRPWTCTTDWVAKSIPVDKPIDWLLATR